MSDVIVPVQPCIPLPQFPHIPEERTPLLDAIYKALRGNGADPVDQVHRTRFAAHHPTGSAFIGEELEVVWDSRKVLLRTGGIIRKQWDFYAVEKENIQCVSIGWLDRSGDITKHGSRDPEVVETHDKRPTFGPFARHSATAERPEHIQHAATKDLRIRAIYVFLRFTAHIIPISSAAWNAEAHKHLPPNVWDSLSDSYSFALPFVARAAWPLYPHGVLVQRVLEDSEIEDAKSSGEEVLPTLFTVTKAFTELGSVGVTQGIVDSPAGVRLVDEEEVRRGPLKAVPPTEKIVWVSCNSRDSNTTPLEFIISLDENKKVLTVWRYAYVPQPESTNSSKPPPPASTNAHTTRRKRHSALGHARIPSSGVPSDMVERADPLGDDAVNPVHDSGSNPNAAVNPLPQVPAAGKTKADHIALGAIPKMKPALTGALTMEGLMHGMGVEAPSPQTGKEGKKKWLEQQAEWAAKREKSKAAATAKTARRESGSKYDLSVTMDRMALGGRGGDTGDDGAGDDGDTEWSGEADEEVGKLRTNYWLQKVQSHEIEEDDAKQWRGISVAVYDKRTSGAGKRSSERCRLAICLPAQNIDRRWIVDPEVTKVTGVSIAAIRATRESIMDLLVVDTGGKLALYSHSDSQVFSMVLRHRDGNGRDYITGAKRIKDVVHSTALLDIADVTCESGIGEVRACFDFVPKDELTASCLRLLSMVLPDPAVANLHRRFFSKWLLSGWMRPALDAPPVMARLGADEFESLASSLYDVLRVTGVDTGTINAEASGDTNNWDRMSLSPSYERFAEDPVMKYLKKPQQLEDSAKRAGAQTPRLKDNAPATACALVTPALYGLHLLAMDMRLSVKSYGDVLRLCPVICTLASIVRPEWVDFWATLCPTVVQVGERDVNYFDNRIPAWPPDGSAILFGKLTDSSWVAPLHDIEAVAREVLGGTPSYAYGAINPLVHLPHLYQVYRNLGDKSKPSAQRRAADAISYLVDRGIIKDGGEGDGEWFRWLPLGIMAPIQEAARMCQVAPLTNWSAAAYSFIGRNDLAARAVNAPDPLVNDGYGSVKDFVNPSKPRKTITEFALHARSMVGGEIDTISGVELGLEDFTSIRFGQDRRLDEVARILCSSVIPNVRYLERPELKQVAFEHDQTREQQNVVLRVAERTLALPYGRAMFTFGSVSRVTREAYSIPKLEYAIRLQPLNITVAPEPNKISADSTSWGEFHNGVAAALRISSSSRRIESSWIAFNKPSDLSPEHAGFLLGLGLTGHLKGMLTWHTFSYLTPKHDLTSIGVLLGLAAANVGTGNHHVMKLLAVHTPALLPLPSVDLNVSLMTQAAGLAGVGLLCMGTKNRRMAEVCLGQISRRDLVQPDLNNEHREAYTHASAIAFGMIMLGKGSNVPADAAILNRLGVLVHGEHTGMGRGEAFDINLTSPAATIALGLMYLRTNRHDVAEMLNIPDTVLELNRIQPSFVFLRTLSRALIMWDHITPTSEWFSAQLPRPIAAAVELRFQGKPIDDALELAYYNLSAACCFALGLKYAGTARQEAYIKIISHFDLFTQLVRLNGNAFDQKIKRSAIRDGLNMICISLSMVMAGTGEITCLRRLRYAYGIHQQAPKYGVHIATHMSLGLLFLGGGRFTLGTSDAAIACMIAAFFPRTHQVSNDNKSYLQALRHLWVLAVEPRCLVARDIDTSEVVYLPVKITMKDGKEESTTQLISPTLIPDLDHLSAIRVDTPRYWPFYLDVEKIPKHRESLLNCQTLYVKRRTAFLSYTEDPRGSRSLFVRSGSSSGDAFLLDFPQLTQAKRHPANDLSEFITSFSNDVRFLAFADHFSRSLIDVQAEGADDLTERERLFQMYCHASLLDCILQDKPSVLQAHLTLWSFRNMKPTSKFFHLRLADLRFCADFYDKLYTRRFGGGLSPSGKASNPLLQKHKPPLIRDSTVGGVMLALDNSLKRVREMDGFKSALRSYANGLRFDGSMMLESISPVGPGEEPTKVAQYLSWYLLRHCVPASAVLFVLKDLAQSAHALCMDKARNDPASLWSTHGASTNTPGPFMAGAVLGASLAAQPVDTVSLNDTGPGGERMAVDGEREAEGTKPTGLDIATNGLDEGALDLAIKTVLHSTGTKMAIAYGSGWSAESLEDVVAAWQAV
ncbi:Anaphase-promoting complex subunit 1 [Pleurotus ostreatus]|uniref:Anaphase-promoting complex subunit 1 n=1 Tax=Pleurotus ostreatus TaxID=5322 RepID=A0A8H6ZL85_PLEOS|nr:Anaphase-promoting complex subunit 1 [Pleurotus ostreatus]KAF7420795.1 Anaphase-promoting complex subunit 1 [Pleurotus ostreatus]